MKLIKISIFALLVGICLLPQIVSATPCCVCNGWPRGEMTQLQCDTYNKAVAGGGDCIMAEHEFCEPISGPTTGDTCCVCPNQRIFQSSRDKGSCDKHSEYYLRYYKSACALKEDSACAYPAAVFAEAQALAATTDLTKDFKFGNIVLGIKIPGLQFSAPPTAADDQGNIYIPWIGEYIRAIYNFAMIAISIAAVIILILQGLKIITSAGGSAKTDAYKRIAQVIIGLAIAWGSYVILYSINPNTTRFQPLKVEFIPFQELPVDNPDDRDASMGGTPLPVGALALSKSSGPRMSPVTNLPFTGGKVERCSVIDESAFQSFITSEFDMKKFSDGKNGACLVQLFNSAKIMSTDFLGRTVDIHPVISTNLGAALKDIADLNSDIVKYWKDPARFTMAGCFIGETAPAQYTASCKKATVDSVVVLNKQNNSNRLYTKMARVMFGQATDMNGDLHALGMACDVYASMNIDGKPMTTNVPKEVADAFMKNGFTWGGGDWGRDPMHFEYHSPSCYTPRSGLSYPKGNGCCAVVNFDNYRVSKDKKAAALPNYSQCKNKLNGRDLTYEACMGPSGAPGSIWAQQTAD